MFNNYLKVLIFSLLLLVPLAATQAKGNINDTVYISAEEIIDTNLYLLANQVTIDGSVSGDLVVIAKQVTVTGQIAGDLLVISPEINFSGQLGGNFRAVGGEITINGNIARNATILADQLALGETSNVAWDLYFSGQELQSAGNIEGSLAARLGAGQLSGQIGRDLDLKVSFTRQSESLVSLENLTIDGDFKYQASQEILLPENVLIAGELQKNLTQAKSGKILSFFYHPFNVYLSLNLLLLGLIFIIFSRKRLPVILKTLETKSSKAILPGLIILLVLPLISLVSAFTLIGIYLSLTILALWVIILLLGKLVLAIFVGQTILTKINKLKTTNYPLSLLLGLIIFYLLFLLPVLGGLINLFISLVGAGTIYLYVTNQSKNI